MSESARSVLASTLMDVLHNQAPRCVHAVRPGGRPPTGSQCFALPRLMVVLSGHSITETSSPAGPQTIEAQSQDAIFTCPQAWTRGVWRAEHNLLAIVCHQGFTRFLRFNTDHRGRVINNSKRWYHTHRDTSPPLAETFRAMTVASERGSGPGDPVLVHLAQAALQLALEELQRDRDHSDDTGADLLRGIRAWIEEHGHEDCSRNAIAKRFGVHPNHLSRLVRLHANCRFIDLITEIRLDRAAALLAYSTMSVAEIATELGFSSSTYLIRRFRDRFGTTPGLYRKQVT
ncbi:MAG: AraC family transcriptional regulator [Planctomycetota bacterium]|jgi:AraC-like DNA-binding protein|nr:AraC family transcriptional regulator [Planctomycetota bacterium]